MPTEIYPVLCSDTNGLDLSLAAETLEKAQTSLSTGTFLARSGGSRGGLVQSVRLPRQERKKEITQKGPKPTRGQMQGLMTLN